MTRFERTRFELTEVEALADSRRSGRLDFQEHDFSHFIEAQEHNDTYRRALNELRAGRKETHWIWYVFPILSSQPYKLSGTSEKFALENTSVARMYLEHPVLGPRLEEAATAILLPTVSGIYEILHGADEIKLHKSMTLFEHVHPKEDNVFRKVLVKYFNGKPEEFTLMSMTHGETRFKRGIETAARILEEQRAAQQAK
jgi:uncharacterized protein (DUF1810 family)